MIRPTQEVMASIKVHETKQEKNILFLNYSFLPGGNAIFLVNFGDLNKWSYVTIHKSRLIF